MLISHRHQFIFIHIPRSAGIAMATALHPFVGRRSFLPGPRHRLAWEPDYPHYAATEIRDFIGRRRFVRYFKFAFIRNPWERILSRYYFLRAQLDNDPEKPINARGYYPPGDLTFEDWLLGRGDPKNCIHPLDLRPQTAWITDEDGTDLVDYVGRFEHVAADFRTICDHLGIEARLDIINRQKPPGDYRDSYTPAARDFVTEHFARHVERWGCTFDPAGSEKVLPVGKKPLAPAGGGDRPPDLQPSAGPVRRCGPQETKPDDK